jgi:hypothetical protein
MPDMLVKLYALPPLAPLIEKQMEQGIIIRRSIPPEKHYAIAWIRRHFNENWVSEAEVAYAHTSPSIFIAHTNTPDDERLIGFGCYDTTRKGFFGPTGVSEAARGRGTGAALLLACLHDMWAQGYGYAIIGAAGPVEFYQRTCGATIIEGSIPGVYAGMLESSDDPSE